jgi:hypothetical protein
MRFEFRASMLLFFVAILVRGVAPRSRWLLYTALIYWLHREVRKAGCHFGGRMESGMHVNRSLSWPLFSPQNFWFSPFILGLMLCDLETTFAQELKAVLACRRIKTRVLLWGLRLLLAYGWFSCSTLW